MRTIRITGTGSALPGRIVTNKELEQMVETSDEWIRERTGIPSTSRIVGMMSIRRTRDGTTIPRDRIAHDSLVHGTTLHFDVSDRLP